MTAAAAGTLERMHAGDHACLVFDSEDERRAQVCTFVRAGLEGGEKVVYVADEHAPHEVLEWLRDEGVDGTAHVASGQLALLTAEDAYLAGGRFDPHTMVATLARFTRAAEEDGYSAFRITGEMSWALRDAATSKRLLEYERLADEFFASGTNALAVCQYDRRRFAPETIRGAHALHALRASADIAMRADLAITRDGATLALAGSVDHTNADELARAVATVPRDEDLRLDLRGLAFMDVAGLRVVHDAAVARRRTGRTVTCEATPDWLPRVFAILGWGVDGIRFES